MVKHVHARGRATVVHACGVIFKALTERTGVSSLPRILPSRKEQESFNLLRRKTQERKSRPLT